MNWDPKRVDAILAQSDEELLPKVEMVMEALGLPEHLRRRVRGDMGSIRERASQIGEEDLARAEAMLGDETLTELVALLEKKNG